MYRQPEVVWRAEIDEETRQWRSLIVGTCRIQLAQNTRGKPALY